MKKLIYSLVLVVAALFVACGEKPVATFTNPLLPDGPDPWAIWHDGYYYYMHTTGSDLRVWKTKDVTDLANAECRLCGCLPIRQIRSICGLPRFIISMASGISTTPQMMAIPTITSFMFWRTTVSVRLRVSSL